MNDEHTLFVQCIQHNGELLDQAMHIDIADSKTVSHLKEAIKEKKASALNGIDADRLILWRLTKPQLPRAIRSKNFFEELGVLSEENGNIHILEPTAKISSEGPWPEGVVHVLAQLPAPDRGASDCIGAAIYSY